MTKNERIKSIEELYDNMHEKISNDIGKDDELKKLYNELLDLEAELINSLGNPECKIFDEYLTKESELIDCERRKAFKYGYNLSSKLMIDSLRE